MFCTACGAAMPADAKFCPKCGAPAVAKAGPEASPAPAPGPAPAPQPPHQPAVAGTLDPSNPKVQAEIACSVAALVLLILGFIGIANGFGNAWVWFFAFADVALGACALQAVLYSRKARFAQAAQMAIVSAIGLVVLGVLAIALAGGAGGSSLVIALLLAAATGFAYWRFSKLG